MCSNNKLFTLEVRRLHELMLRQVHWSFGKSKFNLVAPASPIECLLYKPKVRAIQYKLGPERLTRLVNSNVLRLPVFIYYSKAILFSKFLVLDSKKKYLALYD